MAQKDLTQAKAAKKDEFYTQYQDIQNEVNAYLEYDPDVFRGKTVLLPCDDPEWSNFTRFFAQNFQNFGLKKLISTSFAAESKQIKTWQPTLFETENPNFDADKSRTNGKIFVLDRDTNANGKIDIDDLQWQYLEGDGDFRSDEVKKLRDESDIIVTNPPFSLFREFIPWLIEADKKFLIIGNINSITYKEVFPLFGSNKIWAGTRFNRRINGDNMTFLVPDSYPMTGTEIYEKDGKKYISVPGTAWFTNIDHGRRHQPMKLMTKEDNIKFSKHKNDKKWVNAYLKYDNYDAIEVPFTDAIPSDYDGVMGVPISSLDKYCPEQFEILGATESEGKGFSNGLWDKNSRYTQAVVNGVKVYKRLFIRKKRNN
ncbi:MAG: adenine-specific methyltransferase EcoRI family protein [Salinivirgaceae bacterium]|nr:adenine-specific methyltransferase EcoRI family protein [Salinivirgaceae bacterium]